MIGSSGYLNLPGTEMLNHPMTRWGDDPIAYLAAIPLGVDGAFTVNWAPIDPLKVLIGKPEMLFAPLIEV